jgi:hypothetical protein
VSHGLVAGGFEPRGRARRVLAVRTRQGPSRSLANHGSGNTGVDTPDRRVDAGIADPAGSDGLLKQPPVRYPQENGLTGGVCRIERRIHPNHQHRFDSDSATYTR